MILGKIPGQGYICYEFNRIDPKLIMSYSYIITLRRYNIKFTLLSIPDDGHY